MPITSRIVLVVFALWVAQGTLLCSLPVFAKSGVATSASTCHAHAHATDPAKINLPAANLSRAHRSADECCLAHRFGLVVKRMPLPERNATLVFSIPPAQPSVHDLRLRSTIVQAGIPPDILARLEIVPLRI